MLPDDSAGTREASQLCLSPVFWLSYGKSFLREKFLLNKNSKNYKNKKGFVAQQRIM